jgi:hypothetical protein
MDVIFHVWVDVSLSTLGKHCITGTKIEKELNRYVLWVKPSAV